MKRIAIQDANILIDLIKANLLVPCMQLPYRFCTTDIIFEELYQEQAHIFQPFIEARIFHIIPISEEDVMNITRITALHPRLSEQDCSAYYYAQSHNALLLTGDKYLKEQATLAGIEAHGILWLFDELVLSGYLSKTDAIHSLRLLMNMNKRMPIHECNSRLERWSIE